VTEVAFHTGLPDKLDYACRLLRKAFRQGVRVAVAGAPDALDRLDEVLWVFEPDDFVPHCRLRRADAPPARLRRTPIWLVDDAGADVGAAVLVNLGPETVPRFEDFERVVELVGTADDDSLAGRARWRRYAQAGIVPVNHPFRAGG
jgi:DNA polymerase-3 subunit chi